LTPSDPDYVEAGMRKIADFERRASGQTKRTPKNTLFQTRNGAAAMLNQTTETLEAPPPPRHRTRVPDNLLINGESASATVAVPAKLTVNGVTSLLDVILHAGSDPNFDVEKFRALVTIQREEQDRADARADRAADLAAEAAFNAAMTDVQRQMGRIATDAANTSTRSRYASYGALDRAIRPLYTQAGFNISFNEDISAAGADMVRVLAYVTHASVGADRVHSRTYHTDIPSDGKGAKGGDVMTKTHAHVSATSYGKRVLLGMIFNIATGNDDDGNAASARPIDTPKVPGTISDAQAQQIRDHLDARKVSHKAFLQFVRLSRIEDIGAEHFDRALNKIRTFGGQS
jgi:hypothetical protein